MKKNLIITIIVFFNVFISFSQTNNDSIKAISIKEKKHLDLKIYYDINSDEISPNYIASLDRISEIMKNHNDSKLIIKGHADKTGDSEYNKILSLSRAYYVKIYLIMKGIHKDRLVVLGYGDKVPYKQEVSKRAYELNRRVEFDLKDTSYIYNNKNKDDEYSDIVINEGYEMKKTTITIYFDVNKDFISAKSEKILQTVIAVLRDNTQLELILEGHADKTGNKQINKTISEARATNVKNYLINNGIDGDKIDVHAYGDTKPLIDKYTKKANKINRRVEVIFK